MRKYQAHPQVNGGLRTFSPVETSVGVVSKHHIGKVTIPEDTDHT